MPLKASQVFQSPRKKRKGRLFQNAERYYWHLSNTILVHKGRSERDRRARPGRCTAISLFFEWEMSFQVLLLREIAAVTVNTAHT